MTKQKWVQVLQEIIGSTVDWPRAIKKTLFATKKPSNPQRFALIVFLRVNGVQKNMTYNVMLNGIFFDDFDAAARRQIRWVNERYPNKGSREWTAWNVAMRRTM